MPDLHWFVAQYLFHQICKDTQAGTDSVNNLIIYKKVLR